MKTSKLLITSLLAAAAMSVPAWAGVMIADGQISYATDEENVNAGVVTIGAGSTYQWNRSAKGTWVITSLNGTTADTDTSGSLVYLNRQNKGTYTAALQLSGDNDFAGTIKVTNTSDNIDAIASRSGHANAFIVLNSVGAAKNATVCVGGDGSNGATSATHAQERLVVGVDGAKVAGLTGVVPKATVISRGGMTQTSGYYDNDSGTYDSSDTTVRTLELTGAGSYTFAGVVEQNVSLNKTGTGTQIFSGEVNSGVVLLSAGTLVFSGTANIANSLTVTGGTLRVTGGTLDLSGATVSLANAIQNSGQVTLSTGTLFEVSTFGQTVSLISGAGTISGVEWNTLTNKNFTYNGAALGRSAVNVSSAGSVNISSYVEAKTLTWNGSASDTWSEAAVGTEPSSKPWKDENDADDAFYAGDSVVFSKDETTTVTVADSGVLANTVTISAGTVSFTGGTIRATGGVFVTGGTLSVGATNTFLGTKTITLSGGTLQAGAANLSLANAVNVAADSEVNTQTHAMALSGAITGTGTLTKAGTGSLVLSNANLLNGSSSFASKILVSAGTLKLGNNTANLNIVKAETDGGIEVASGATLQIYGASANSETHHKLAKDIVLNDGAFLRYYDASQATQNSYQYELSGTITVNGTATITGDSNNHWAKEVALRGNLSGSGTLTYYRGAGDENFNSNGRLIIAGADNSGFTGTIVIGGQSTAMSQGLDLRADLANGTISLQGGSGQAAYMRVLKSATIKGLNGNANSSVGIGNVLQGGAVGAYTLTVGEGNFAGTIEDNGEARRYGQTSSSKVTGAVLSLVKNTTGTLTLGGNNTFSGGVTIERGVLVAGHANALGTTAGTTTVNSGGVLKVAVDGGVTAGMVTLNEGALFAIDLTGYSNVEEDTALTIISSSAISFNSTSAGAMSSNNIEAYFSASNSNLGSWSSYLREWSYDTTNGLQLTLTIPEPSVFGLLAGLGALALAGTRRRRKKA